MNLNKTIWTIKNQRIIMNNKDINPSSGLFVTVIVAALLGLCCFMCSCKDDEKSIELSVYEITFERDEITELYLTTNCIRWSTKISYPIYGYIPQCRPIVVPEYGSNGKNQKIEIYHCRHPEDVIVEFIGYDINGVEVYRIELNLKAK